MKKILITIFLVVCVYSAKAQDTGFGLSLGYHNLTITEKMDNGIEKHIKFPGIYAGFFAEFRVTNKFFIKPEAQITFEFNGENNFKEIVMPLMFMYYLTEDFNVQIGPQGTFDYGADMDEGAVGIGMSFGASYNFNHRWFVNSRYTLGVVNMDYGGVGIDRITHNSFQFGLGFRLY